VKSIKQKARFAGLLYLLVTVTGIFSLMYVPSKLIVRGNAAATARNILGAESLFRFHLLTSLLATLLFLCVAFVLYQLLKKVGPQAATLMLILVVVQVPLSFIDVENQFEALEVLRGAPFLSVLDAPQRESLAMLFLHVNHQGIIAVELLWGLWLFPLGWLVFRSAFLPRFLGVWLIANGVAYAADCAVGIVWPRYLDTANKISFPFLLGEVALTLWLLIVGAKDRAVLPGWTEVPQQ
jgi:hypothetical protein